MTFQKNPPSKAKPTRRAILAAGLALTLSAGGASAWALDRFVVQHVEISDVSAYEASQGVTSETGTAGTSAATLSFGPAVLEDGNIVDGGLVEPQAPPARPAPVRQPHRW